MPKLNWKELASGSHDAYSGSVFVGFVLMMNDGRYLWELEGVRSPRTTKMRGFAKSMNRAKALLGRAWSRWLDHAGLMHIGDQDGQRSEHTS